MRIDLDNRGTAAREITEVQSENYPSEESIVRSKDNYSRTAK